MSPVHYSGEEDLSFRRYSNRGYDYPLSHERGVHRGIGNGSRNYHLSSHDSRNNDHGSEQDSNGQSRRRIPVACGRCRKRKIRCSGDPGNGGSCSNCKSAGNEQCQFLRVSSTEAQMKSEAAAAFCFEDSAAARLQIYRQYPQIGGAFYQTPQVSPASQDSLTTYRNPAYQYPVRNGIYAHSYQEYGEDGMEYPNYPILMPDHLATPAYSGPGSSRLYNSSLKPSQAPLFLEQDPGYGHSQVGQMTGYSMSLPFRQAVSQDIKPSFTNGMSNSFHSPVSGNDRMLPAPATNIGRPTYLRSNESGQGPFSSSGFGGNKALNGNAGSENASVSTSYLPVSNSQESMSSSNVSYSSQPQPMKQQQTDYSSHHGLMYSSQNQDSSDTQSNYGPSDPSSKSRHGSQSTDGSTLTSSTNSGMLSSGYQYYPPPHRLGNYPMPPVMVPHHQQISPHHPIPAPKIDPESTVYVRNSVST